MPKQLMDQFSNSITQYGWTEILPSTSEYYASRATVTQRSLRPLCQLGVWRLVLYSRVAFASGGLFFFFLFFSCLVFSFVCFFCFFPTLCGSVCVFGYSSSSWPALCFGTDRLSCYIHRAPFEPSYSPLMQAIT